MVTTKEEFIKKYGFWKGDNVVHHSYIHKKKTNKAMADRIFSVSSVDLDNEYIKLYDRFYVYYQPSGYYRAERFEKIPALEVGNIVIAHKPVDVKYSPTWISEMDVYDGKEIEIIAVHGSIVTCSNYFKFNLAWLEVPKEKVFGQRMN